MKKISLRFSYFIRTLPLSCALVFYSIVATANPNPEYEGFGPPAGWTLSINGTEDPVLISEGDTILLELTEHARDFCGTQPCISQIAWDWFHNDTYYQPFGAAGDGWSVRLRAVDLETSCRNFQDYHCEVEVISITNTGGFCAFPRLDNIAVLQVYINGELFDGVPNIGLPYIIGPDLYVNLEIPQCDPVASILYEEPQPQFGDDPLVINFDGTNSFDPDELSAANFTQPVTPSAGIVSWVWDFGDGGAGFGSSATHAYTDAGEYEVTLEVTDNDGVTSSTSILVNLAGELYADFFATQDSNDPFTYFFDAGNSFSGSGPIEEFYWEFGDGDSSSGPDLEFEIHTYTDPGYYSVFLEVYDFSGNNASASRNVFAGPRAAPQSLVQNQWKQFSVPANTGLTPLIDFVSPVLNESNYGTSGAWVAYEFVDDDYQLLDTTSPLVQGRGYWLLSTLADPVELSLPETSTPTRGLFFGSACPDFEGCFDVGLNTKQSDIQWNLVGYPYELSQTLNNTRLWTPGGLCNTGCTLDDANANDIALNLLYRYNPISGLYDELNSADPLNPWDGYWMAARAGAHTQGASWITPYP